VCVVNCQQRASNTTLRPTSHSDLAHNSLTGLVPPLPFKQYSNGCGLDDPDGCGATCNHFKCPLPAGSEQCKYPGGRPGVHCK
jgi:hypothetical protein